MRPFSWLCSVCSTSVSIHAPRAECDLDWKMLEAQAGVFQSTHPRRSATLQKLQIIFINRVSIHAPRVGCDLLYLSRE